MRTHAFSSALLAVPFLLALPPRAQEITFHPADDSRLGKSFAIELELELDDVEALVAGQDLSSQVPELSLSAAVSWSVIDHFVKTADGKPLELVRELVRSHGEYRAM